MISNDFNQPETFLSSLTWPNLVSHCWYPAFENRAHVLFTRFDYSGNRRTIDYDSNMTNMTMIWSWYGNEKHSYRKLMKIDQWCWMLWALKWWFSSKKPLNMHLDARASLAFARSPFLMRAANKAFNLRGFGLHCPVHQVFFGSWSRGFIDSDMFPCLKRPVSHDLQTYQTLFKVTSCRKFKSQRYPLVN